ncbi:uncharacterized protein LOC115743957 isoform X2 [Rhodamnia argentea]|uniref:Uncharacterized protein LOC115743957 isoform X2 n=1 Tax=Rhodamnia argentea TaxID=178133 RepID=A0A8B8PL03_9MYRT|nr:uncharacterized protein LOC115743957 isoform X2 [Rhodamnia argentea]
MAAGIHVEEDDDEGFGDFAFATSSVAAASVSSNGRVSASQNDDDWSDFVSFGPISSSKPITDPSSNSRSSAKMPDFFADRSVEPQACAPAPSSTNSPDAQWLKLKRAIPLSIFGEEEENEGEPDAADPSVADASHASKLANGHSVKRGSDLNVGVGLNELLSNLYDRSPKVGNQNGTETDHNANSVVNGQDLNVEAQSGSNLKLSSNGIDSSVLNGNGELADDEEWEFKFVDAESVSDDQNIKEKQNKVENDAAENVNVSISSGNGWNFLHVSTPNFDMLKSGINGLVIDSVRKEEDIGNDFGWEFKGAEFGTQFNQENCKGNGATFRSSQTIEAAFDFSNSAHGQSDLFVSSKQIADKFVMSNSVYDLSPSPKIDLKGTNHEVNFNKFDGVAETEENDWDFRCASSETGSSSQDDLKLADNGAKTITMERSANSAENLREFKDTLSEAASKHEKNEKHQGNGKKEALPLSLFGDEDLEKEDTIVPGDAFIKEPAPDTRDRTKLTPGTSINDLISSLYSESMPNAPAADVKKLSEGALNTTWTNLEPDSAIQEDDFGDWDFQDAYTPRGDEPQSLGTSTQWLSIDGSNPSHTVPVSRLNNNLNVLEDISWEHEDVYCGTKSAEISMTSPMDSLQSFRIELKPDDLVQFYGNLKDELCLVARRRLNQLKAQGPVDLAGENAKAKAHDEEIQELHDELLSNNSFLQLPSDNISERDISISTFLEVLSGEKFHVIEAEYSLSSRLSSVERDLKSLVELLRHVALVLKILKFGSAEEQSKYVSTWSKMISACARELKHGALIWKQALGKNVSHQILSDKEGKQHILALGEVYRAVGVLGASAMLYKPWILLNYRDFSGMSALLDECTTIWSSSGLEEALQSISDPLEFQYEETVKALLESIKHVYTLDVGVLQKAIFSCEEPVCRLSLLNPGTVPGMKMIVWDEEQYFLKLANLWANLISRDPPELPCIKIHGS